MIFLEEGFAFYESTKLCTFQKNRVKGGAPEGHKVSTVDRSFPVRREAETAIFVTKPDIAKQFKNGTLSIP